MGTVDRQNHLNNSYRGVGEGTEHQCIKIVVITRTELKDGRGEGLGKGRRWGVGGGGVEGEGGDGRGGRQIETHVTICIPPVYCCLEASKSGTSQVLQTCWTS